MNTCSTTIPASLANISSRDKDILSSPTGWLNDTIINAAQTLLKQQTTTYIGFQNTLLGANLQFRPLEMGRPFIQILHVSGNHWITSTNAGCKAGEIKLFDSAVNSYITLRAKQQICSFLLPMENTVKFNLVNMQVQQDTASCGLFSIAVAAELVAGKDPAKCKWDVGRMRDHLIHCFESNKLTPFPRSGTRRVCPGTPFKRVITEKIFCKCRMPNDPRLKMIKCSMCSKLYHCTCCRISGKLPKDHAWTCHLCN